MTTEQSKYALAVGGSDLKRMTLLGEIYMPYCQEFLINNGLAPGMNVADVGCGPGNVTLWLAQQVGTKGKVTGIDNSSEQLAILNERISTHSCTLHMDLLWTYKKKDLLLCKTN